jgi:quercetin 2,3-dioxygenase
VATGSLARSSLAEPLSAGDAFRISDQPGLTLTAASPTQLLVWSFT